MKIRIKAILIVFFLINNINAQNMNSISKQQQSIAKIAANTAIGNLDSLTIELNNGLDNGLTISQIREVLTQMYAYSGFPRSLQGINTFMNVIDIRQQQGIIDDRGKEATPITDTRDKYVRGKKNLQQLTHIEEGAPTGANAFAPAIDSYLKEHLFADIFERDILTFQEREIATISALSAMVGVDPMLRSHINIGKNTGLTDNQVSDILLISSKIGKDYRAVFQLGNRGPAEWFSGEVYVNSLINPDQMEDLYSVGQVTFMPGGRTHWHTHPIGQSLLVLEGDGWYQERGKPAQRLVKGSIVAIPKDIEHWHGASDKTKLVHVAISNITHGSSVTWTTPVNEEEYREVNK